MSTTTDVKIALAAEDHASVVLRRIRAEVDKLTKSLSRLSTIKLDGIAAAASPASKALDAIKVNANAILALKAVTTAERRAADQRKRDATDAERQRRQFESTAMRDFRSRMVFLNRLTRERLADERTVERERQRADAQADRDATASARRKITLDNYRYNLRERHLRQERQEHDRDRREVMNQGRSAWGYGKDAYRDLIRPPAAVAAIGTGASVAATRRILGAESAVDAAEVNTRSYGNLSADAARTLRDQWAAPLAESLGSETSKLLTAWVDATKLGIPAAGAKSFAELSTKTSAAWEVPFETVTDILGTVNSLLTSTGESFDINKLKSVANTVQHLAAKQSTTPEKLLSFLQRGAGAAQVLGMSQEAGLAFGSASTSLGNQAGQSGRMFDYIASRIIEMPKLTKEHGDQGDQARKLMRALGYGSAAAMDRQRRASPNAFLTDFMERFNRIKNPKSQDQALRFFTGREWLGEFGRMVKGIDTYKEAVKFAKEAKGLDAIGAVWELHRTKLSFVFKQFRAGWLNILGIAGEIISPMARQAGDVFLTWSSTLRNGGLSARFKAAVDGFLNGLGFKDLPALLTGIFGKPGEGDAGSIQAWGAAARGFGAGLRDVGNVLKAFFSIFTRGDASPETIGRWAARIMGFSAALVIASPVIGILGGIGTAILAFTAIARGALAVLRAMDLAGGAGAGTAAAGAGGGLVGRLLGALRLAPAAGAAMTLDPSKADQDRLMGRLGRWALDREKAGREPPATVQQQSYNGAFDLRGLLHNASFGGLDRLVGLDRALIRQASFSNAAASIASSGNGPAAYGSRGASNLGIGMSREASPGDPTGFGSQFSFKGGAVPGWYGKGGGGGPGGRTYVTGDGLFDAIIKAEGTAKRGDPYQEVLGYGAYGRPSKKLTDMNLAEVRDFGLSMRRAQSARGTAWNRTSSASGAFQITGSTMMEAAQALGMDPATTTFSPETQRKMAAWIARKQGLGAWEGFKVHPDQRALAATALNSGNLDGSNPGRDSSADPTATDIPGLGGTGQYDGLRVKGGQAIGGGATALGVTDLARQAQANLPGSVKHFAAFNDHHHKGTQSKHASGLAFDTTLLDSSKSREAVEAMKTRLSAAGLGPDQFKVIDEYLNPSGRSTGGHIHTQFNSKEAADRYHAYIESLTKATDANVNSSKASEAVDGFKSSGWKKGMGGNAAALATGASQSQADAVTAEGLAGSIPPRSLMNGGGGGAPGLEHGGTRPGAGGGNGVGGPASIHVHQTINGAGENPQILAAKAQRQITEAWLYRSHDLEPELT